jgi:SAM-dependent methyltransferase
VRPPPDTHGLGYRSVDDDPHPAVLVSTMDDTSRWEATATLRAWERTQLGLRPGNRLLDLGCGPGDAALALAADVAPGGEVVGVDRSAAMVAVAQERAGEADGIRFVTGDALALDEPDGSFDAVRCERTLQWVPDPAAAVAELARVLRPGGRLVVIDSDWSTFRLDLGDPELSDRVVAAFAQERARPSNVGGRLVDLVAGVGLEVVATTSATQRWRSWDPDAEPAPLGCFSMRSLVDDLVDRRALDASDAEATVRTIEDAARRGRFAMALTMSAVAAARRT